MTLFNLNLALANLFIHLMHANAVAGEWAYPLTEITIQIIAYLWLYFIIVVVHNEVPTWQVLTNYAFHVVKLNNKVNRC